MSYYFDNGQLHLYEAVPTFLEKLHGGNFTHKFRVTVYYSRKKAICSTLKALLTKYSDSYS